MANAEAPPPYDGISDNDVAFNMPSDHDDDHDGDGAAASDPAEAIDTFWALTRFTASALARRAGQVDDDDDARATTSVIRTTQRQADLVAEMETLARRNAQRCPSATPQRPLPLRVPRTDPRHLRFRSKLLVGDDAASAVAFLDTGATAAEWRLALNVGAASLFLRFPRLSLASPALASALVAYLTRDEVVRPRPRTESAREAREKRLLAAVVLKLFAAEHRDTHTAFGPGVVAEALATLVRTDAKPRHVRFAYQLLLVAPPHVVNAHPLVGNVAVSVERLHNACIVTLATRLTKRLARAN